MNVIKIKYPLMDANSYLLYWEEKEAFLIDCVPKSFEKIQELCKSLKKEVYAVFLTHGHIDHMVDAKKFQERGAKIFIGRKDRDKLYTDKNLSKRLGIEYKPTNADFFLENTRYTINGHHVDILETPGHTPGSVCISIERVVFTGDTLFRGTVGRTDFEDSEPEALVKSLKKIIKEYKPNQPMYPGHGLETNLEIESKYNPFLQNL